MTSFLPWLDDSALQEAVRSTARKRDTKSVGSDTVIKAPPQKKMRKNEVDGVQGKFLPPPFQKRRDGSLLLCVI